MANSYEMKRTNSICPKPEEQLLELVKSNQLFKIKDLVRQHPNILEKKYGHPYYKPILSIAVSNFAIFVNPQTIETLLEVGANAFAPTDMFQNKSAIHHAAISHNEQALKVLIEHTKLVQPENIDLTAEGDTPLLALIKECEDVTQPVVNCVKILLENGADFNKSDANDRSPILHASRKGFKEIVQLLIEQPGIDIDSHYLRKKNARNFIIEKALINEEDLPSQNQNKENNNFSSSQHDSGEVFRLLKSGKEAEFLAYDNIKGMMDLDDGSETPLQICARLNLHKAAKHLINLGADPNRITARKTESPLEICAKLGHHKVFEVLLDCEYTKLNNVLSDVIKYSDSFKTDRINHQRCFELLLEKKSLNGVLNQKNSEGNTPLHYAARYSHPNTTLLLLNKGASLGDENKHGFLPIEDIEPELLEEHFNQCINTSNDRKIDEGDFTVTFNYKTLLPSDLQEEQDKNTLERIKIEDYNTPMIFDNKNSTRGYKDSEMKVIKHMAKTKELRPLLIHPLITSFLYLKWHRISGLFYANLVLYIATWFSLTTWIFMSYNNPNYEEEPSGFKAFSVLLLTIIWLSFLVLTIKELFQFIVSPLRYLKQTENYIEVALITSIFLILLVKEPQEDFKKQISAIAILVSAFQLVLLVGQHPKMSTSIVMLRTVSFSFLKFFLWYAILILAFALSFYTLFNENNKPMANNNNVTSIAEEREGEEEEEDAFKDAGVSLFKTFVMLTGEFDASDIDFKTFPITSRILFVVFIFMIAIVLFNLLNGLAVSDTQLIKNNAELFAYTSRIDHICYVENMLLGNLASLPDGLLKFIRRICCLCPGCELNITLPKILARRASLFPHYLCDLQLEIYLNRNGTVKLPLEREKSCVQIDKKTVKNVRTLLKERNKIDPNEMALQKLLTTIVEQQNKIETLENGQKAIVDKLNELLQKL